MLVLTRRENDRVVFPDLGITVEISKLSRSRAMVAIDAPRGVRIMRHELLEEGRESRGHVSSASTDPASADPPSTKRPPSSAAELSPKVEQQVEEATRRLQDAMELLKVGSAEDAYDAIAVALSELDVLSTSAKRESVVQSSGSQTWSVSGTVAESSASYSVSDAGSDRPLTVRLLDGESERPDEWLLERLRGLGYEIGYA
ncbi:MAG: carbon storage regulator [Planctomycetota bacterium]